MTRQLPAPLPALLLAAVAACTKPEPTPITQVVVVVYSDATLAPQLTSVAVDIRDDHGLNTTSRHDFTLDEKTALPISFGVKQPRGGADWFMLVARGIGADNAVLVEHKVIAHFEPHQTGLLQVYLGSLCLGELCTGHDEQTCQGENGTCTEIERVKPALWSSDAGLPVLEGDASDQAVDAATLSTESRAVPATGSSFSSLGSARSDGTFTLHDDGFEATRRVCTRDGMFCISGSFGP